MILQQLPHRALFVGLQIHAEMGAELASVQHDGFADRLTRATISREAGVASVVADPQVVVEAGDGIADDLLPLRQEEGEVRKNARARRLREIGFLRRAAPDVITGIDRLHRGSDLLAYARTDAIAADEEIGALAL